MGSSPLVLSLNLRFEALSDAMREVVLPCKMLQRMSLPSTGRDEKWYDFFSLIPPGPNPFTPEWVEKIPDKFGGKYLKEAVEYFQGNRGAGDIINIHIGRLLLIPRVIIKEVEINFSPQFTKEGYPVGASASLIFETFEILTKESLDSDVYNRASIDKIPSKEVLTSITKESEETSYFSSQGE